MDWTIRKARFASSILPRTRSARIQRRNTHGYDGLSEVQSRGQGRESPFDAISEENRRSRWNIDSPSQVDRKATGAAVPKGMRRYKKASVGMKNNRKRPRLVGFDALESDHYFMYS